MGKNRWRKSSTMAGKMGEIFSAEFNSWEPKESVVDENGDSNDIWNTYEDLHSRSVKRKMPNAKKK